MKIRKGFVSNSSSTSFVLIGYIVEEDVARRYISEILEKEMSEEKMEDAVEVIEELNDDYIAYLPEFGIAIGHIIQIASDEGYVEESSKDFSKIWDKVVEIGKKLGLGNPKLCTGTYAS